MLINVQITFGFEIQIEAAVPRKKLQHVIEEANARRDLVRAGAVQIQAGADIGFGRVAVQSGGACFHETHPVEL
jgi:PHP family Zn ribbon phosphoesterase